MERGANRVRRTSGSDAAPPLIDRLHRWRRRPRRQQPGLSAPGQDCACACLGAGRAGGGNLREPRSRRAVKRKKKGVCVCVREEAPCPLAVTWRGGGGTGKANGFREGAVIWPGKEEPFLPLPVLCRLLYRPQIGDPVLSSATGGNEALVVVRQRPAGSAGLAGSCGGAQVPELGVVACLCRPACFLARGG